MTNHHPLLLTTQAATQFKNPAAIQSKTWQSSAGLATNELVKHFGGVYSVSRIAHESTISLLDRLSKGKLMTYEQLKGEAHRIANARGFDSPDGVISILMDSRLVDLGFKVKCTTCGRHPWIEISSLKPVSTYIRPWKRWHPRARTGTSCRH